jgi:dTDP-4-amino-4,6-dideoxygalactose transaminase
VEVLSENPKKAFMNIPLSKPYCGTEEIKAVTKSIRTSLGTGDGPSTKILIQQLQRILGVPYVLPVTSGTHGLEMILSCLDLKTGDEVIVPSFTMSSTANAVLLAGATPVFADIEGTRYTIDPEDVKRHITPRTKGIIMVHYAGMPSLMEELLALAKKYHLFIVEDAAHTIGATYKGKALGTFGDAGAFSFHGTKNICCGEGGAVVTNNENLANSMETYRQNGTNRRDFLRGKVDKYTWVGKGTSFFLSDILASILVAQVKKISIINRKRKEIAQVYTHAFEAYRNIVQLPVVPPHTEPNWHIYALRFKKEAHAGKFLDAMRKKGIEVSTHYVPLHDSPMGRKIAGHSFEYLPVTELVAKTLVRLPIYPDLNKKSFGYIIRTAQRILARMK